MWLPNDPKFKLYNDYAINATMNGQRPLSPNAWIKMIELKQQQKNQKAQGNQGKGTGL